MEAKINNKTTKKWIAVALLLLGQQAAFAVINPADTTQTKPAHCDSTAVTPKKNACCEDTTVTDHSDPYHKVVKEGGSVRYGLFTVRHIKDDWYLEVPDSLLGRMMLAVTRFTSTPQGFRMFSGEEVNRSAIYLEQYGPKAIFMREYVQSHLANANDRIAISLKQSTADPIVVKFDVIGRNPKTKDQLINVTKWLMSDNKISSFTASDRTQIGVTAVQADRTFIDSIKTYPINVEIQTLRTYGMNNNSKTPASATGSVTLALNTSIVLLPERPMQPRYFDNRVGYFNNTITEFSDNQQTTNHEAIISRYRLEPKDPQAYKAGKLVEPKKQIVYYIDPATPKKWVKYLKAGIDDWNVAFEAAGFKNAIVAKEFPQNDTTMSIDDARFSMIRYLPSETENAYGPRIVDPRSGEIIEAHICWYHNVMNLVKKWYMTQCGPLDKKAQTMDFPDELMGQLIRFVSSHEVGHSLGLRHNMIASQATPVEKLRDKAWVEKNGHTSSIMDYARFNYVAQPEDGISRTGIFPRIGDYDKWAITWGYKPMLDAKDELEDHKMLEPMVLESLKNRRLWWGDGEGVHIDPRRQTEDLGDDPVKASYYGILNLKRLADNLRRYTLDNEKDIYDHDISTMYNHITNQMMRYCGHVTNNIGGYLVEPKTQGMGGDVYEPQPLKKQKAALKFIDEQFLHEPVWLREVSYAKRLTSNPQILTSYVGQYAVTSLLNRLDALNDLYTPQQYLTDLSKLIFTELDSNKKVTPYRIALQNNMLSHLERAFNNENQKIHPAVLYTLQQLQKKSKAASTSAPDVESRAHWGSIYDQIGRILVWK